MPQSKVALTGYKDAASVREVIERCDGFAALRPDSKVLIKPNLVGWDNQGPYPPWGVLTTSVVMDALCAALRDYGASDITIGEGSIDCAAIGSNTGVIYENLGYQKLRDRYGVTLVDFNEGEFDEIEIAEGHALKVTRHLSNRDFLISAPVLKTHGTTRVSLGMKNLKGLLKSRSKMHCHHAQGLLDQFIANLTQKYPPALTLIDGIYAMEQGPLHFGRAHRANLLIASTDVYAADLLGAHLIGYAPEDVRYMELYAEANARTRDIADLDIVTDMDVEALRKPLEWDWQWSADGLAPVAFEKQGISGLSLPKYDDTVCTGCSYMFNPLMLALMSTQEKKFDGVEVLSGKKMLPSPNAKKTFLFGNCQIAMNRKREDAGEIIFMKGCPPTMDEIIETFRANGLPVSRKAYDDYRAYIMKRYLKKPEEFERAHFYL